MFARVIVIILVCFSNSAAAQEHGVSEIAGTWKTVRHGALVSVSDCGDGTPCAHLLWIPQSATGGCVHDIRNMNADLRERTLIGLPILWGFSRSLDGWRNGHIYNPDDGKTFRAHLRPISPTELEVTGCLGPLCRSQIWSRIE